MNELLKKTESIRLKKYSDVHKLDRGKRIKDGRL